MQSHTRKEKIGYGTTCFVYVVMNVGKKPKHIASKFIVELIRVKCTQCAFVFALL